jgi:uncharacterized protein (DUF427 family)
MGLTLADGPLSTESSREVNYRVSGPERLLFFGVFPRRVRARFADHTVLDTRDGRLLHESGLLPVLYVPDADVDSGLLRESDHTTHCPFKGNARYWSVDAGGRTAENAVWAYPEPIATAAWLRGYKAVAWDVMDAWYDEDEEVHGHLRDPFHRVDVRAASGRVRILAGDEVVAESSRARVLSETGLPNRYYLPRDDVRVGLRLSDTSTVCPYKGTASYWSVGTSTDVAWSYEEPLEDALKIQGHLSFDHDDVSIEVD